MKTFAWDRWLQGGGFAVALAALPVLASALADHHITPPEWSILGTTCSGAFFAYLKTHRPPVALPPVPPELVALWEEHKAEAEKAALAALVAALKPEAK